MAVREHLRDKIMTSALNSVQAAESAKPEKKHSFHAVNRFALAIASMLVLIVSGCATAPLTESGLLSSYTDLEPSDGMLTKTRLKIDKNAILMARSISITPSQLAGQAGPKGLSDKQLHLVTNAIDRALCAGLSERFEIVPQDQPADLTVHAVITHLGVTDAIAAGASSVASIGGAVAEAATGVPIPVPRIPIGMGGLSIEASATSRERQQIAAMTWARGADALTIKARASEEGDAYQLAKEFAADFSKLLVTGSDPMKDQLPSLPSTQSVSEYFGGKQKYTACEQYGRNPGLGDTVGGAIGLPPGWTDSGSR
jgi:Protein of unknown function (DUF3313)